MVSPKQKQAQLIQFLRWELAIPASAIAIALRHPEQDTGQLPMILWQYGLVSLEQLDRIFDWLAQVGSAMEPNSNGVGVEVKLLSCKGEGDLSSPSVAV